MKHNRIALLLAFAGGLLSIAASYGPSAYVDTVATLIARVPQPSAPIVTTLGTNAVNDGGGRTFIWVPNDATATNETTVFASPHATGRRISYSAVSGGGGGGGSGTVTSVALTAPTNLFDVAGSPVTGSGTLAMTFDTQTANTIFAGPTTGAAAAPTFRTLVDADIPSAIARYSEVSAVYATDAEVAAGYQPLDADLTALAGLSTTGLVRRTGSGTASIIALTGETNLFLSAAGTFLEPAGTGGGASTIGTNNAEQGWPVAFQADLSLATTNVLTVSTQTVDVLVLTEPLSISNGGTGTNSAAAALANLGGQPLDADLTALANGTAIQTAMSNAVSVGAPTMYVGTTNVAGKLAEIETIAGGSSVMSWDISQYASLTNTTDAYSAIWSNAVPSGQTRLYNVDVLMAGATNHAALRLFSTVANRGGSATAANWFSETNYSAGAVFPSAYLTNVTTQAVLYARGPTNEPWSVFARGMYQVVTNGSTNSTAVPATYLVKQGFEGTGYDNSETWVTVAGSPDPDYATDPLVDSQSLRLLASGAALNVRAPELASPIDSAWVYFQLKIVTHDTGAVRALMEFRTNTTVRGYIALTTSRTLRAYNGTVNESATGVLPTNTVVHIWSRFTKSSGASDGITEVYWSTNSTKPGTGDPDYYVAVADGNASSGVNRFYFGSAGTATHELIYDKVRVDDENIGSSPE